MPAKPACPVCGGMALTRVLSRRQVPVHQNLVFTSQSEALAARRGDLTILACDGCGFVFNLDFDPSKLEYGPQYDNTQLASPRFQEHVGELVRHLLDERGVRGARIVEVGCGKGAFLRALIAPEDADNRGIGFDPSYVGPDEELDGRLRFERRFYDETCTDVPADVVVSRHVIEHVPEPLALLRSIFAALRHQPGARLFLETPCVAWILRNVVIWDLFYEHCSLFTARSLTTACELAGFTVESVRHVFGGQYLWLEAVNRPPDHVSRDGQAVSDLATTFAREETQKTERWRTTIRELAGAHRLALWGAAAKGVTFANVVDPDRDYFSCLTDMNPAKHGGFTAGTGHPIVPPDDLDSRGITAAVLLNPNYRAEIEAQLRARGSAITVLDIGSE